MPSLTQFSIKIARYVRVSLIAVFNKRKASEKKPLRAKRKIKRPPSHTPNPKIEIFNVVVYS